MDGGKGTVWRGGHKRSTARGSTKIYTGTVVPKSAAILFSTEEVACCKSGKLGEQQTKGKEDFTGEVGERQKIEKMIGSRHTK